MMFFQEKDGGKDESEDSSKKLEKKKRDVHTRMFRTITKRTQ